MFSKKAGELVPVSIIVLVFIYAAHNELHKIIDTKTRHNLCRAECGASTVKVVGHILQLKSKARRNSLSFVTSKQADQQTRRRYKVKYNTTQILNSKTGRKKSELGFEKKEREPQIKWTILNSDKERR